MQIYIFLLLEWLIINGRGRASSDIATPLTGSGVTLSFTSVFVLSNDDDDDDDNNNLI